ncbi:MAG: hypothetical protein AB2809_20375 [Candidatus Thiodiazotropha sp.]
MNEHKLQTFPVAGWDISAVPSYGVILFRPSFLSSPFQKIEEANSDRSYLLTVLQAKELKEAIGRAIKNLEDSEVTIPREEIN